MLTRDQVRARFGEALRLMDEYPCGEAPAQRAARRIVGRLQEFSIPYVVVGDLAVAARGHLLIEANGLPRDYADQLHPCVQAKFDELWGYVGSGNADA